MATDDGPGYGSGPCLDDNFDFDVDESGDVRASTGFDELVKDVVFNVARALQYGDGITTPETVGDGGIIGSRLTGGALNDVELAASKVINDDPRVDAVLRIEATEASDRNDQIELDVDVRALSDTTNFSFVVGTPA